MNNELNSLLNEYNFKKDMLDNHTKPIVAEIRRSVLDEDCRLRNEYAEINSFVKSNLDTFTKRMNCSSYSDHSRWSNGYLTITIAKDALADGVRIGVGLDTTYKYKNDIGSWSKLPSSNFNWNTIDENNDSLDYWLNAKRSLAIRNEEFNELVRMVKSFLKNIILEQDNREKEMIASMTDTKYESVTISVIRN